MVLFGLTWRERKDVIGGIAQGTQRFAFAELDRIVKFQRPGHDALLNKSG